ncbi:aspartate kinase [Vibrio sp. SCSIO 43136]|uniref:aspartate kinase n=1 Tax=Vibrio sp. SCSIO 43136 TaxID=2819101 RepID=UPI0020765543|nr:aspartate kinase [Vibrio sp. SCSIO 43136]USD66612.1 aspartate kinase [Vibrio sp. SCSIO 43136]
MHNSLIVQKYGGTSVGSVERIEAVAERVIKAKQQGHQLVVVVSAMSGETNRLMDLAQQIDVVPAARELDVLLAAGEQVSMSLLAMALNKRGIDAVSLTGWQAGISTNTQYNDATINDIDTKTIDAYLAEDHVVIVAGFQGITDKGNITTLGRGGSDTTAVALAGALKAAECQIFTDVDGVYSCDPRVVSTAKHMKHIDFPSMEEMACKGAKVLHLPSVQHAWRTGVALRVLSSFTEGEGTLVAGDEAKQQISGLALQRDLVKVEVAKSEYHNLSGQCQLLGIDVWGVIETNESMAAVISANALAKLNLILSDKIRATQAISALNCVGGCVNDHISSMQELLAANEVQLLGAENSPRSVAMFVLPDQLDFAANLVHNSFVVANVELDVQPSLMVS